MFLTIHKRKYYDTVIPGYLNWIWEQESFSSVMRKKNRILTFVSIDKVTRTNSVILR